jgi:hypothetical protein
VVVNENIGLSDRSQNVLLHPYPVEPKVAGDAAEPARDFQETGLTKPATQ